VLISLLVLLGGLVLVRLFGRELWTDLTGVLTGLAVVSITWTAVPAQVPASDVLLGIGLVAAAPGLLSCRWRAQLPAPCFVAGVLVALAVLLNALLQVPQAYADGRYLTFGAEAYDPFARQALNALNGAKLLIALIVLPVLLCVVGRDRGRLRALLDLWVVSAATTAFVAMLDYVGVLSLSLRLGSPFGAPGTRGAGLTNHPVHMSTVLVMAMPLVLTWLVVPGRRRQVGAVLLLVLAGGVFVSGSRTGLAVAMLCVLVATLVIVPLRRLVLAVALPVGLLTLAYLALEKLRIIGSAGQGSDTIRAEVARQAVRDIKERPLLGIGFDVAGDGHSVYLQAVAAGGLLTLGALIAHTAAALRTVRLRLHGRVDLVTAALLGSVAAWLLLIVTENALVERYMYLPLAFLLVLAQLRDDETRAQRRADLAAMASSSAARVPAAVPAQV
jgi:hypothetical protein